MKDKHFQITLFDDPPDKPENAVEFPAQDGGVVEGKFFYHRGRGGKMTALAVTYCKEYHPQDPENDIWLCHRWDEKNQCCKSRKVFMCETLGLPFFPRQDTESDSEA